MAKILIVDDHETDRALLRTLLGYSGHQVIEAVDGEQALQTALREHPDLVISDVLMPTMDGFEFVRSLRRDSVMGSVPVMFYSASYRGREAASLADACGVSRLLLKPSEPEILLRAVDDILGREAQALPSSGDFDRDHLRLVQSTLTRTAEEAKWLAHRLDKLIDINLHLASERVPAQLLRGFCLSAREFLTARHAMVAQWTPGTARPAYVCVAGIDGAQAAGLERDVINAAPLGTLLGDCPSLRMKIPSANPQEGGLPPSYPSVKSLLAVPLTSLKRIYGWICLTDKIGADEFSPEDEQLLGILAAQVGRIYENGSLYTEAKSYAARLEVEVEQRARAQARLGLQYRVAEVLASTSSFAEAAPQLLQAICMDAGFAGGALWAIDAGVVRCIDCWHEGNGEMAAFAATTLRQRFSEGEGVPGNVWKTRTQAWIPDLRSFSGFRRLAEADAAGISGIMAFPVMSGGAVAGVMEFYMRGNRVPELAQADLFTVLSSQIGQFIERREQQVRIAKLARIHAVMSSINALIVRVRTRDELFQGACTVAVEQGGFGIAWIGIHDPLTSVIMPVAWAGVDAKMVTMGVTSSRADRPEGQGTLGRAVRERAAAYDNDIALNPGVGSSRRREAMRRGYRSVIALPLVVNGEVDATLALFAAERDFFTSEELKLLNELAGDLAFALANIAQAEKLDRLSFFDVLTGLPNRQLFTDRLGQLLEGARVSEANVAVGMIDLERFRQVNFSLGRHAGDALLKSVAARMRCALPANASLARIGADVFAVAMPGRWRPNDSAHLLETAYNDCFGEPFEVTGEELRIGARIGLSMFPGDGEDSETLCANAEVAVRKARAQRARFLFYAPDMNARATESLRIESRLRRAIGNGELLLHYQPKVSIRGRRISGAEALMRWMDPVHGLIAPAQFIPVMEQTGLIFEASRWALSQAMADARQLRAQAPAMKRIAVNLSTLDLQQKDFVAGVLKAAGSSTDLLELEITESMLMEDIDSSVRSLHALREAGITIALDDFGTGYSSLAYIARLPINSIKIDRSFIAALDKGGDSLAIIRSMVSLAHALGMKVVAEGVETEEQAAQLWQLHCDEMQGYLVSRPVPGPAFLELLRMAPGGA